MYTKGMNEVMSYSLMFLSAIALILLVILIVYLIRLIFMVSKIVQPLSEKGEELAQLAEDLAKMIDGVQDFQQRLQGSWIMDLMVLVKKITSQIGRPRG